MTSIIRASSASTSGIIQTADASGVLALNGDSTVLLQSNGVTQATVSSTGLSTLNTINVPNTFGFKNRIINGAMVIDQRNAGASVTPASSTYTLDRWLAVISQSSKFSVQQNAGAITPPTGFTKYLGVTSLSAYSVGASDYFSMYQGIEGLNVADLGWGTANAQTITLSFWVRSSLTGTFGGSVKNNVTRSYPFTYTISTANTWELKTVTVAGDTSGTWATDNSVGIYISLSLGAGATFSGVAGTWAGANYVTATGATSIVGTNGATFYITGVQLEVGSTATSFDVRDYGRELILCQRYFQKYLNPQLKGVFFTSTIVSRAGMWIPTMRTTPTPAISGDFAFFDGGTVVSGITSASAGYANPNAVEIDFNAGTTGTATAGRPAICYVSSATGTVTVSAEL
jgi:hypothetical protein